MPGMEEGGDESGQSAPVVLSFASCFEPGNTNNLSLIQFPDELYQKVTCPPQLGCGKEGEICE